LDGQQKNQSLEGGSITAVIHHPLKFYIKVVFDINTLSKETIRKISDAAEYYDKYFSEKNLLIICGKVDGKDVQTFSALSHIETLAKKDNFFHLTGLKEIANDPSFTKEAFFDAALEHRVAATNFAYRDANTELKFEVLLKALDYKGNFKMLGDYNHGHPKLKTDILVGGQQCCIGFIKKNAGYYKPNTVLKADVRNEVKETRRVLAIMQKEIQDRNYTQISYLANDVYAHKLFREFCLQNPDAPVSQSTINYSTLLPRQQAKEQMFFALEQKEEQKKEIKALLDSIADSRKKAIINNDENALKQYYNLQNSLHEKIQQTNLFDFAKEILEKQQSKTSNDDIASEIQTEISQIDKLKLEYETKGRTATVSFSIHGKNDINTPKFAMSNGEYVATATRQITFDIPIPPRKPLKALYIKMRDVVHSIADKFKSKPDNKSSGSGNGSSISKPQTDNNQSKDKKPEQKQDISQTIPSQPSVQTDIPNNSLSEEDKAVRTIIEQATGKKAEEMSPQLFEQLFEQVKELYQENIVNQAKPQHKSEPAPKTAEPKEEPTEHSLTAEKDSYEIDL